LESGGVGLNHFAGLEINISADAAAPEFAFPTPGAWPLAFLLAGPLFGFPAKTWRFGGSGSEPIAILGPSDQKGS
tara:strand:- start:10900 stop:11124 length:225 start_codon:yes stop_codon:yes gene_type:complete